MGEPKITVEGTPNPNAAKFVLDRAVPGGGSRSYFDPADARGDRLAERLFDVDGVRALFMVDDFITVTKEEEASWPDLVERVEAVIREQVREGDGRSGAPRPPAGD